MPSLTPPPLAATWQARRHGRITASMAAWSSRTSLAWPVHRLAPLSRPSAATPPARASRCSSTWITAASPLQLTAGPGSTRASPSKVPRAPKPPSPPPTSASGRTHASTGREMRSRSPRRPSPSNQPTIASPQRGGPIRQLKRPHSSAPRRMLAASHTPTAHAPHRHRQHRPHRDHRAPRPSPPPPPPPSTRTVSRRAGL